MSRGSGPAEARFDLRDALPGERYCAACANRVCDAVREVAGIVDASCDVEAAELTVSYDPRVGGGPPPRASYVPDYRR